MWVLDARFKAEKVWYPVVWEKVNDAENVIDYDIHDEVTVDTSSVFNANNDTTTGMATVIPWVNAPKLIANTSIYWIEEWWDYAWWVYAKYMLATYITVPWYEEEQYDIRRIYSLTNERWYYTFKYVEWKWLIMPANWAFKLKCVYSWGWAGTFRIVFHTMIWNNVEHSSQVITTPVWTTETFIINTKKWQPLRFRLDIENTWITNNLDPEIRCTVSKWE